MTFYNKYESMNFDRFLQKLLLVRKFDLNEVNSQSI